MTAEENMQPADGAATEELYHTNLLRLQATQLLSESMLPLSSHIGMLHDEVKWAKEAWAYIDHIKRAITSINSTTLSPDELKFKQSDKFWTKLFSDKARKHFSDKQTWEFPFQGGESLKMAPIHSYAANGAGLTTSISNANTLPTLDLAVLMPVKSKFEQENDDGFIGGKDYLNGRYFDVSLRVYTA